MSLKVIEPTTLLAGYLLVQIALRFAGWFSSGPDLLDCACRYEGQMQSQRLRMVSDNELRLEQFHAERKDEKRRYEDALDRLKQVGCASLATASQQLDITPEPTA